MTRCHPSCRSQSVHVGAQISNSMSLRGLHSGQNSRIVSFRPSQATSSKTPSSLRHTPRKPPEQKRLGPQTPACKINSSHTESLKISFTSSIKTTSTILSIILCLRFTVHFSNRKMDRGRSSSSSPRSKIINKPSASRGRAPDSALPDHSSAQPVGAALSGTALPATSHTNIPYHPFSTLPASSNLALAADASVRMPPLAAQAQLPYHFPSTTSAPFLSQWPAAPTVDAG
ncbi:hypothetical protein G5714_008078 [Onychostoma macrolepis]|uniref:Uncharacterized protein n=1 Tax=Onychostoma macrolepis TaxID=369639 RepID=A0A7J6CUM3_9TELE|nr:hypothetical protein G5714_008078 [Onychostoma macrolepis]